MQKTCVGPTTKIVLRGSGNRWTVQEFILKDGAWVRTTKYDCESLRDYYQAFAYFNKVKLEAQSMGCIFTDSY